MKKSEVYIIDALNYIFRAFHGLPESITAPSGMAANAVLGYSRTLLRIIKERRPEYMVAAFEGKDSFRSQLFDQYKATRAATPKNLGPQIEYCKRFTEAMGIPVYSARSFEADDIIGTVAQRMSEQGHPAVIVTGDKDMSQLVCDNIRIYDMAKEIWLDEAGVRQKFGVNPSQIPDLLALHGDSVDNIPGVPGVGQKTARQLLSVCRGIEDLAFPSESLNALSFRSRDRILEHLRQNMPNVRLSRQLATICCDVPLDITPDTVRYKRGNRRELTSLCDELGFTRILGEIPMTQSTLF